MAVEVQKVSVQVSTSQEVEVSVAVHTVKGVEM